AAPPSPNGRNRGMTPVVTSVATSARKGTPGSASKIGSDSDLMNLRRRLGSDSGWGSEPWMGLTFRILFRADSSLRAGVKDDDGFVIAIRGAASVCRCPACGGVCDRVHSQYRRRLADLPAGGVRIALILRTRRFFCDAKACARRIFAERFEAVESPQGVSKFRF